MNQDDQQDIWALGHALADAARPISLKYFRAAEFGLENKRAEGFDPVTQADREIEVEIRRLIEEARPQDGILGEEYGPKDSQSGLTWVIDPIDGTRGFISGTPTWGVLIALSSARKVEFGIIDQPFTQERFIGGWGKGLLSHPTGDRPFWTRKTATLSDAIIFSTFPEVGTADEATAFHRVADHCKLTRYGTDCYAYGLLATGQIDLVIEAGLAAYDVQGPIGVVEAAGGVVTDWEGGNPMNGGRIIAAANADIHQAALDLLAG